MLAAFEDSRLVPLGAIVQRVADSFEAHARLIGLQLDCSVTPAASVWKLPEDSTSAAIRGALFAAVSSLEDVAKPRIELRADSAQPGTLTVEVIQRSVRVSTRVADPAGPDSAGRADEIIPALALRTARSITASHGGSAELKPLPGTGAVIRLTFVEASSRA